MLETASGGTLVNIAFRRLDVDRQKCYPLLLQRFAFPLDEGIIVRGSEARSQARQSRLKVPQLLFPIGERILAPLPDHVAPTVVVKVEIGTRDSVLVTADVVHAPHEHEAHAP